MTSGCIRWFARANVQHAATWPLLAMKDGPPSTLSGPSVRKPSPAATIAWLRHGYRRQTTHRTRTDFIRRRRCHTTVSSSLDPSPRRLEGRRLSHRADGRTRQRSWTASGAWGHILAGEMSTLFDRGETSLRRQLAAARTARSACLAHKS